VAQKLLDAERRSKNGRAPNGLMDALIAELRGHGFENVAHDKINYHKMKLKKVASNSKENTHLLLTSSYIVLTASPQEVH